MVLGCRSASSPAPGVEANPGAPAIEAPATPRLDPPLPRPALRLAPEDARRAHAVAMARHLDGGPPLPELGRVEAPDTPGVFVPLDGPEHLATFYDALHGLVERSATDRPKVRLAFYGASGTASDRATGYLRTYLQARFGDGGPGFVPWAPLSKWYRHSEVVVRASPHWKKEHAQTPGARPGSPWGYLGAAFSSRKRGAWVEIEPRPDASAAEAVASFEIFAWGQPEGGTLALFVDDEPHGQFETRAARPGPVEHRIELAPGRHRLRMVALGDGDVRGFGVAVETAGPGVVVDTLGLDGTRMTNWLAWDLDVWAEHVRRRDVALLAFSYGTNEASDRDVAEDPDAQGYRTALAEALRRVRTRFPDTSCLLLLPGDYPIVEDTEVRPRPRLLDVLAIQRVLGPEAGCAMWDGMAFMGGPASMGRFVLATPPLAHRDHLHFNARGSVRKAQALADALMQPLHGTPRASSSP